MEMGCAPLLVSRGKRCTVVGRDWSNEIRDVTGRLPATHSAVIRTESRPPGPHVVGAAVMMKYEPVTRKSW